MSDDLAAAPVEPVLPPVDPSGRWVPGEQERSLLRAAAVCSVVAGGMNAFATWMEAQGGPAPQGFTLPMGLSLAAIVFQIVVVTCLGKMAEQTQSRGLQISGGCFYGCGWLLALLILSQQDFIPQWLKIVLWVVVGLGILAIVGFIGEKYKGFESGGGVLLVVSYILARVGGAALFGGQLGFGETALFAAALFLVLGLLLFWVLYGITLIANQGAFGTLSAVLGVVYLGCLAYFVFVIVQIVQKVVELANQPGMNEQMMEKEMHTLAATYQPSRLVIELTPAVLTALWFLALRSRSHAMDDVPPDAERRGVF